MFAPAATLQTKSAQQPQRTTQPTSDLVIALAKLTLQHEQERQNRVRSENVVLQASASHPMMQGLEAMVEMYRQREPNRETNTLDTPKGNDRMLSCAESSTGWRRMCGRTNRPSSNACRTEESVAAALKRVLKVGEQAVQNRDLKALRCFRVKSKDEAGQDIVRWIFAHSRQRQLKEDLWTLREAKTLELLQFHLLENFAPRIKAAKQVQQLAFGTVPVSTKSQNSASARARPGRGRRGGSITHYFVRREGN